MPEPLIRALPDAAATDAVGRHLAAGIKAGLRGVVIYLDGDLGAGKTTLARGLLRGLGHVGRVPSPTYTLVEPYDCSGIAVYHADLYRLLHPDAAAELGLAEMPGPDGVLLVEWANHGLGHVPPPDLVITLEHLGAGRRAQLAARTEHGRALAALAFEKSL